MNTNTYNGWTNYATWRVNLEICDDLIQALDGQTFPTTSALAAYLEEAVDDILTNYGQVTSGFALDYARSFVNDVDWLEIAEHAAEDTNIIGDDDDDDDEPLDDAEGIAEYMSDNPQD